jgi:ketosteroid isomerase-like protein
MSEITEQDFRDYIAAFNRNDFEGFGRFYAEDVAFDGRAASCRTRDDLLAFYRKVKARIRETLVVHGVVVGDRALVADVETELHPLEDWLDFPTGALRRGETVRSQNFIWYDVRNGKFARIRSAHYRKLGAGETAPDMRHDPNAPAMNAEQFAAYIDAFNRDDYGAFGDYYDEQVVLVIAGKRELRGRQAIFDFYKTVKSQTRRVIQVKDFVSAGNLIAAELESEFEALTDLPDFTAGPMKKGGRIYINTVVLYELREGRFARIRSGEVRKIARP